MRQGKKEMNYVKPQNRSMSTKWHWTEVNIIPRRKSASSLRILSATWLCIEFTRLISDAQRKGVSSLIIHNFPWFLDCSLLSDYSKPQNQTRHRDLPHSWLSISCWKLKKSHTARSTFLKTPTIEILAQLSICFLFSVRILSRSRQNMRRRNEMGNSIDIRIQVIW